jgi:hypothetical protein
MKIDKIKKKLQKESDEGYDVEEDSDIIVHEKRVKGKKFKMLK